MNQHKTLIAKDNGQSTFYSCDVSLHIYFTMRNYNKISVSNIN